MGDVLQRTLHHPDDGPFFHLHGADLQRLLLQVSQHIWLWLERESNVRQSAVDVSRGQNKPKNLSFSARGSFFPLSRFIQKQNPPIKRSAHLGPQCQRRFQRSVPVWHRSRK